MTVRLLDLLDSCVPWLDQALDEGWSLETREGCFQIRQARNAPPPAPPRAAPPPPKPSHRVIREAQEEILIGFETPARPAPEPPRRRPRPRPALPERKSVKRISISRPEPKVILPGETTPRNPPPPVQKLLEVISAAHLGGAPFDMLVTWFRTSPRELKKVLDGLVESGHLEVEGDRYRIDSTAPEQPPEASP